MARDPYSLPGYDAWKLASPPEDPPECPFCDGAGCLECLGPDPDDERERRDEDREFFRNLPDEDFD